VACSADASKLVAVAYPGFIYTSMDSGATWIPRETSRTWQAVASSADGAILVAVAFGGQIYTSTNSGVTWTAHESNRYWQSVASSADGRRLIAGAAPSQIYTSTDSGETWTASGPTDHWVSVASSTEGSRLIAAGGFYTDQIFVSPPLVTPSPSLSIFSTVTNTVVISWPSSASNWNIQQGTNLATMNWATPPESVNDDGTHKSIVVNPPAGNMFYRLKQ
jgi:hypothetical protein